MSKPFPVPDTHQGHQGRRHPRGEAGLRVYPQLLHDVGVQRRTRRRAGMLRQRKVFFLGDGPMVRLHRECETPYRRVLQRTRING